MGDWATGASVGRDLHGLAGRDPISALGTRPKLQRVL